MANEDPTPVPPPLMDNKWTQRTILTAFLFFVCVFVYDVASVLDSLDAYDQMWNSPKIGADLLRALVWGLGAMGTALGLDVVNVVRNSPLGKLLKP